MKRPILCSILIALLVLCGSLILLAHSGAAAESASEAVAATPEIEAVSSQAEMIHVEIHKSMDQVKEQMSVIKEQMKQVKTQIKQHVHLTLDSLKDLQVEIPDITIPEINIPEIKIDLPNLPAIPGLPHMKDLNKNFKGETVSKTFEQTYPTEGIKRIQARMGFGSLKVIPSESDDAMKINVEMTAGASTKENATKILDGMAVKVERNDNVYSIVVEATGSEVKENNIMFYTETTISVPKHIDCELGNSFGDMHLENLENNLTVKNEFGTSAIVQTKGTLEAVSKHGGLRVAHHEGEGTLVSEFGEVRVNDWTGDLDIKVSFGTTRIVGLPREAKLNGEFSFGDVTITLPKDFAGSVRAITGFGKIDAPDSLKQTKDIKETAVEGTIGSGNGSIQIKGSFSPIKILLQDTEKEE